VNRWVEYKRKPDKDFEKMPKWKQILLMLVIIVFMVSLVEVAIYMFDFSQVAQL
jgi:antibiotic biosynthesis monooxygenase (ABM) superfamily enzyme